MGYCCADCGDSEHTCIAWDGRGYPVINREPNHNLVKSCPKDIAKCEYRRKKTKSKPMMKVV